MRFLQAAALLRLIPHRCRCAE
eukprot:COSAG06_NODE_23200_length_699_cov_52.673333_2_plen_21_part_01